MPNDAQELDALAAALNRSAERLQTLWFTFLAVTVYFGISAFTTTHRMLLLDEAQMLPVLDVRLPLLPFYIVAPAFYVVVHSYMLMMLILLARTARTFDNALNAPGLGGMTHRDRERYRVRMENAIFLQIIVGAERERLGANGRLLRAIALISVVIAPLLVLLLFQVMFLPYHSEPITWWHRGLIFIDLVLVWTLWPSYRREGGERMLPRLRPVGAFVIRTSASVLVLAGSVLLATFPSEPVNVAGTAMMPQLMASLYGTPGNNMGWFANRLWLPGEDFVDDDRLRKLEVDNKTRNAERPSFTLELSRRNLAGANLADTDLRRVNLADADLRDARLWGAWLQGASLENAQLQRAELVGAQLQGAVLDRAQLQRARLAGAQFQGASLAGAELQGTLLTEIQLEGATLDRAKLQGASLEGAQLQGASLLGAQLQGASLAEAQLQGASLERAQLQGTLLRETQLDGASLKDAQLRGAWLQQASVWRTHGTPAALEPIVFDDLDYSRPDDRWQFPDWRNDILNEIPEFQRPKVAARLSVLDPGRGDPSDQLVEAFWEQLAKRKPADEIFEDSMARVFTDITCEATNGRYVAGGIADSGIFEDLVSVERRAKLVGLFDEARQSKAGDKVACPGARKLTDYELKRFCVITRTACPKGL